MEKTRPLAAGHDPADSAGLTPFLRAPVTTSADSVVYDRLTALVATLLDAPIALLTLVSPDSQLFFSVYGIDPSWQRRGAVPVTDSFCQHAVRSGAAFVIGDARSDPLARGLNSALDEEVVAYLGVPLVDSSGQAVGSCCAVDTVAREWRDNDVRVLTDLAATVVAYMESRPIPPVAPRPAGLNIAAVSRKTGVAADTLRKWERRYGVLRPERTAGGQRRYDDHDVSRVEWLRDRLSEGFRIGAAAALLEPTTDASTDTAEELSHALVAAAHEGDAARLVGLVEQAFTLHPLPVAIEEIVAPALRSVDGFEPGTTTIAEEHLLSATIRARLERMLSDRRAGVRGKAVLACAPEERHELGLLALGVMLQADGWVVAYLGAALPIESTLALARQIDAELVCLSVTLPESLELLAAELESIEADGPRIVVGGSAVAQAEQENRLELLQARPLTVGLAETVVQLRSA